MADIAAAAGKDHTGTVRHIQHTDCEIIKTPPAVADRRSKRSVRRDGKANK